MTQRAIFLGGHFHGHTRDVRGSEEHLELALPEPPPSAFKNQSFGGWTPKRREVVVYLRVHSGEIPEGAVVFVAEGHEPDADDEQVVRDWLCSAS